MQTPVVVFIQLSLAFDRYCSMCCAHRQQRPSHPCDYVSRRFRPPPGARVCHLFARQRLRYHGRLAYQDSAFRQGIGSGCCELLALAELCMLRVETWRFESLCGGGLLCTSSDTQAGDLRLHRVRTFERQWTKRTLVRAVS